MRGRKEHLRGPQVSIFPFLCIVIWKLKLLRKAVMTNQQIWLVIFFYTLLMVHNQNTEEWSWSQAYVKHTRNTGQIQNKDLSLAAVVMHGNQVYPKQEWEGDEQG